MTSFGEEEAGGGNDYVEMGQYEMVAEDEKQTLGQTVELRNLRCNGFSQPAVIICGILLLGVFAACISPDPIRWTESLSPVQAQERRSFIAVTSFTTPAQIAAFPWTAVTDVGQAINRLSVSASGKVKAEDSSTWPDPKQVLSTAHNHGKKVYVGLHIESKQVAATLLNTPSKSLINSIAKEAIAVAVTGGYDGIQLDIEGLKPSSKTGFEMLVAAFSSEATITYP